jgi:hypothetical protein
MSRVPALKRSLIPLKVRSGAVVALFAMAAATCLAAAPPTGDHEAYLKAAKQPRMQDRLRDLELFASSTETTAFKIQALELMAWYYKQLGDESNANLWARQLLTFDQENPLALAVLVENARRINPNLVSPESLTWAQRGLRRADRFEKPEGLPDSEFAQLRQRMLGILNGTLGYAYFQQKDYTRARGYLRTAVAFIPDDAQFVYALGLANLEGENPNASEGYWSLARAVNLTQGTPAGQQIAEYAANRYREEGGSASDWKRFIASAASAPPITPEPSATTVARSAPVTPSTSGSSAGATAKPAPTTTAATANPSTPSAGADSGASKRSQESAAVTTPQVPASAASAAPPASERTAESAVAQPAAQGGRSTTASAKAAPEAAPVSSSTMPRVPTASASTSSMPTGAPTAGTPTAGTLPQSDQKRKKAANAECRVLGTCPESETEVAMITQPPPAIQRPPLSPRDPLSIGILIQAAIANDENRSAVNYALVDMVRHLRNADEAFILSFAQQLEFQQDLTQNYDLLEAAMAAIRPDEGSALFDAVGFSAGHLARIAKNRNRVLLVISDGSDVGSRKPGYEITGQIDASGVRIYCIGVGVDDAGGRSRLEQLASRTGGRATFIPNTLQFRSAARQIAAGLGIEFPM